MLFQGRVLWFNDISGRGVIHCESDSASVLVNHKALQRQGYKILDEGQVVWFTAKKRPEGLTAEKVYLEKPESI
ncbi:hypothetical protein CHISP_1937 [Chitinispirillum alkaliphilum]|nr:hypothetical protein CHISP_1937 [Chitinispirillum alkaliphilum]